MCDVKVQIAGNVGRAILATALVVAAGVAATVAFGDVRKSDAAEARTRAAGIQGVLIQGYAGKCVSPSAYQDGAGLILAACASRLDQIWYFMPDGEVKLHGGTLCMDVAWASKENWAKLQVARCNGGPGQKFRFEAAGDLVNVNANRCVDVKGWGAGDGTPLIQWQCHGGANQKWQQVLGSRTRA
jgi:streptogrisin C